MSIAMNIRAVIRFSVYVTAVLLATSERSFADAQAFASTSFGEVSGPGDSSFGEATAFADVSGGLAGATAAASARVDASSAHDDNVIILRASASGFPSGDDPPVPGTATAHAVWTDQLGYDAPSLIDPGFLALNPYLYFVHRFHGSTTGHGVGTLSLQVLNYDSSVLSVDSKSIRDGESVDRRIILRLPANALLPVEFGNTIDDMPAQYTLELFAAGGSGEGGGTADFTNTASLERLYFGDDAGNPISGAEAIVIKGASGLTYRNSPVPEPSALACFASIVISLAWRRQRV